MAPERVGSPASVAKNRDLKLFHQSSGTAARGRRFMCGADPLPPPTAPPQHGPDPRDPAHTAFVARYNPMKWLAKPPFFVHMCSIQPGSSEVFGAICWPGNAANP